MPNTMVTFLKPPSYTRAIAPFGSALALRVFPCLLQVGFYCKKLSDFTATLRRRHFANAGTETTSPGHYAYGLAVRIESALEKFREKVLELEDEVLEVRLFFFVCVGGNVLKKWFDPS